VRQRDQALGATGREHLPAPLWFAPGDDRGYDVRLHITCRDREGA
jgi:hypothetical protein